MASLHRHRHAELPPHLSAAACTTPVNRRIAVQKLAGLIGSSVGITASAGAPVSAAQNATNAVIPTNRRRLNRAQSLAFRQWFVDLIEDQVQRPTPRWVHRDCAGLVRFAVHEALRAHDGAWQQAMGWDTQRPKPPELNLAEDQRGWLQAWQLPDGQHAAYASALAMMQNNTRFIGKDRSQSLPGDLLFFDQGDDQHLMVWTGRLVAYHNGKPARVDDNGLRHLAWEHLLQWPDTRWRPTPDNPNFVGLFRLAFLST